MKARKECKILESTKNALNVTSFHGEHPVEETQEKCEKCKNVRKKRDGDGGMQSVCMESLRDVPQYGDERRVSTVTS